MSTTQEPKQVSVTLPAFTDDVLEQLARVESEFERIAMNVGNVVGRVETTHWEARLPEPPTVEQIGGLWLFIEYARRNVADISGVLDELEAAICEIDSMRTDGRRRFDSAG